MQRAAEMSVLGAPTWGTSCAAQHCNIVLSHGSRCVKGRADGLYGQMYQENMVVIAPSALIAPPARRLTWRTLPLLLMNMMRSVEHPSRMCSTLNTVTSQGANEGKRWRNLQPATNAGTSIDWHLRKDRCVERHWSPPSTDMHGHHITCLTL